MQLVHIRRWSHVDIKAYDFLLKSKKVFWMKNLNDWQNRIIDTDWFWLAEDGPLLAMPEKKRIAFGSFVQARAFVIVVLSRWAVLLWLDWEVQRFWCRCQSKTSEKNCPAPNMSLSMTGSHFPRYKSLTGTLKRVNIHLLMMLSDLQLLQKCNRVHVDVKCLRRLPLSVAMRENHLVPLPA